MIEDRAVPGHWEGDLISGSNNTHIATLVERQSRFTMLVKLGGNDTETVVAALIGRVRTHENTNRLLWQYFPKKTDVSPFSQADLNRVARQPNQRPRKTLDFASPAERFNEEGAVFVVRERRGCNEYRGNSG